MTNFIKAELAAKVKTGNIIRISLVATVSVIGLILAVTSLVSGAFLYAAAYLVAGALGILYAIIKINSTFVQSVVLDGDRLILNMWDNGFFPYNIHYKPRFFADFVPAKSVSYEVNLADICDVAIGSRGFLAKSADEDIVSKRIAEILKTDKSLEKFLKRYDILYVKLSGGKSYMMSVNNFDTDALYAIVDFLERNVQGLEFKTNVRLLRRMRDSADLRPRI